MKFFFFDLDGTLEDSQDDMANSVNAVRESLGLELRDTQELKKYVNRGMHDLYINCFNDYLSKFNGNKFDTLYQEVKLKYEKHYLENICLKSKCYPGIDNLIKTLSQNYKIFVVTNKPEIHSKALLDALGLMPYITDVMGGDSCAEMKPSSLPLKVLANRFQFLPSEDKAFMVGDSSGDIVCGKNFGAVTVWCSWGYNKEPGAVSPDFIINNPNDLLSLI